jgi:hypothetical protein
MSEDAKWEYRVHKYSNWRGMKPEELNETLNEWGMEGWEVISSAGTADGALWITAKRPLSLRSRREKSMPSY